MALSEASFSRLVYAMADIGLADEIRLILDSVGTLGTTEVAFVDGVTAGTAAASKAVVLNSGGDVTWVDGGDISLGTSTGTKIGTAVTQKLGFYNATPVVQQADAAQAALTDSSGGSADGTISPVTDLSTSDTYSDAALNAKFDIVNDNFKEVATLLNRIRLDLVTVGLIKGAAAA